MSAPTPNPHLPRRPLAKKSAIIQAPKMPSTPSKIEQMKIFDEIASRTIQPCSSKTEEYYIDPSKLKK